MMKTCTRCKSPRALSLFSKCARRPDGLNGECKACHGERNKAFYQANREREKLRAQEWRQENKEHANAKTAAWRAENRERHLAMKTAYRINNPDKVKAARRAAYTANRQAENAAAREYKRAHKEELSAKAAIHLKVHPEMNRMHRSKRRAQERRAIPRWADAARIHAVYEAAQARTAQTGIVHHVDHIVPLTSDVVCGLHCEANLQVLPGSLNQSKRNFYWPDMPG